MICPVPDIIGAPRACAKADAKAIRDMAEVEAGKLAQQKAQSDEVKKFARNAKDPEVKSAAQKAPPDIQEHLKTAEQMAGKPDGQASAGSSSGKAAAR